MVGLFITMEGPDGAGKTSVIQELLPRLQEKTTKKIVSTREPGGSQIAESIRNVILDVNHKGMDVRTEAILYSAARRQHLTDIILPTLASGNIIFCDRFVDSSIAYQGVARGIGVEEIRQLNQFATAGLLPEATIYLDVPAEVGLKRIYQARGERQFDRLDQEGLAFHQKVRQGYLALINEKGNDNRFIIVDATAPIEEVVEKCYNSIIEKFPQIFDK